MQLSISPHRNTHTQPRARLEKIYFIEKSSQETSNRHREFHFYCRASLLTSRFTHFYWGGDLRKHFTKEEEKFPFRLLNK